jgi:hypothetical protein
MATSLVNHEEFKLAWHSKTDEDAADKYRLDAFCS